MKMDVALNWVLEEIFDAISEAIEIMVEVLLDGISDLRLKITKFEVRLLRR